MKGCVLQIQNICEWNKAAQLKHMWIFCRDDKSSFWPKWVYSELLKGRSENPIQNILVLEEDLAAMVRTKLSH